MKFFLKINGVDNETEVTQEQYVKAERGAGFRPKCPDNGQPATASFSNGFISGRIGYEKTDY